MMLNARLFSIAAMLVVGVVSSMSHAQAAEYGAIAYSPATGSHGYSHNFATRSQAERLAMRNCRKHAGDCRVLVYFYNACAALAVGNSYGYGYAYNVSRRAAESTALRNCRQNDSGCQLVRWVCSN